MKGKRETQKENRREEILRAAMDLFSKQGFELTTVEDITRAVNIAKGTFYNFFVKKEDVLLYFLDTEFSKSRREIERKIKRLSTIAEKIELLIATYIKNVYMIIKRQPPCSMLPGIGSRDMVWKPWMAQ